MEQIDSRISGMQQCLLRHPEVILAALIGSRAKGLANDASDWDLAVMVNPALSPLARFETLQRLQFSLAEKAGIQVEQLDLVDLHAAGLAMREQVANHGILLKGENTLAWSHFLVRTWRELEEFAWERQHAA